LIITLASVLGPGIASAQQQQYLNFNDKEDFENAARGFIGKSDTLTIKNGRGNRYGPRILQGLHQFG
jgi:alkyl sulfatase BDS1-like metallo-beta-lactamase superfamily hydrolase